MTCVSPPASGRIPPPPAAPIEAGFSKKRVERVRCKNIGTVWGDIEAALYSIERCGWEVWWSPLYTTRVQAGPTCGLTALRMVRDYVLKVKKGAWEDEDECANTDKDGFLCEARDMGFSKQGEIFSAYHLAALANTDLLRGATAKVVSGWRAEDLFHWIARLNLLVLIPYDADKDQSPSLKGGAKVHWAIVKGVAVKSSEEDGYVICQNGTEHSHTPPIETLYVIATQGKSHRQCVWRIIDLVESNDNLLQASEEARADLERFVIPPTLDDLRRKCVCIDIGR